MARRRPGWRQTGGQRLVVSSHDFTGMPADLAARYHAMAATGAAVVKVAVTASALADCVPETTLSLISSCEASISFPSAVH